MTQPRQPSPAPHVRKRSPLPWVIFAVLVVVAGIVLLPKLLGEKAENGPQPVAAAEQDPLLVAVQKCDPAKDGAKLAERNTQLIVNSASDETADGLSQDEVTCIFDTLQVPGALTARMFSTTSADGELQGEWPGFTISWKNTTAKGLDFTVTRN
jgi:hypothetical protein